MRGNQRKAVSVSGQMRSSASNAAQRADKGNVFPGCHHPRKGKHSEYAVRQCHYRMEVPLETAKKQSSLAHTIPNLHILLISGWGGGFRNKQSLKSVYISKDRVEVRD